MRSAPTILHLDMDAFYASAEQAAKPSLRGKAVVVGGLGPRGVVATASYEARRFGVHSAMPTAQARRLAPHAAYLTPRFTLYRDVSNQVMGLLRELSPLVEPLSLDEAFVDLEAGGAAFDGGSAREVGERLRADIRRVTGLSGSVGLAVSKMLAKIGSERAKPDGLVLIEPGTERQLLAPLPVRVLPGVGPATGDHLRRAGITTVDEIAEAGQDELVRLLGRAHGTGLYAMALALDERPVVSEREGKSVSVEDTYDLDIHDRVRVRGEVARLAERCTRRLREAGRSGRTVVLKVRRYDFSTLTRSETLRGPTDDPAVVREAAARLLEGVDTTGGVRLLGVGVSGLADYTQEDLFAQAAGERAEAEAEAAAEADELAPQGPAAEVVDPVAPAAPEERRRWPAGHDVVHAVHGPGWVQGSGVGRVTVRFETPTSAPGRVRTFRTDDPELSLSAPLPLVEGDGGAGEG
ncbi:DNA polymerase IV [Streptomyces albidoflavus]|uniref:DNA polymerase IV n=1 Tax=Streptomyces albidoflavus TaxID=1886 RepID=UPI000FEF0787|nr:DNA polymerase IV [Streptomyces albidoflavus]RWZ74655.1 DNA polymerase IV [Streptomyces albidoflavus]